MFPIKHPPQSYLAIPYIVKKKSQVFLRLGFNICPFKCCQSVSCTTFSLIWGRIQVEWMTVSNWLFTLIRDQFWPYELWFGLEGEMKGTATSFPNFTTRFKRLKRVVSSLWCALRLSTPTRVSLRSLRNTVALWGRVSIHLLDLLKSKGASLLISRRLATNHIQCDAHVLSLLWERPLTSILALNFYSQKMWPKGNVQQLNRKHVLFFCLF